MLVRQRCCYDCGVAVAAIVASVRYEAVLDRLITGLTTSSPLSELVLWRCLEDITQMSWCMEELGQPWPQVSAYPFPAGRTAALIQRADSSRHYVAVCDGRVYDPLLEVPVALSEYPDRDSGVVTVFHLKAQPSRTRCCT
jgi:hypothetical protein